VLVVFLLYLQFLAALPARTRFLFLLAATLYVGGALGVEMLGSNYYFHYGPDTLAYQLIITVEEGMEMFGVVTFLYALFSYMAAHESRLRIVLSSDPSVQTPVPVLDPANTSSGPELAPLHAIPTPPIRVA
jgi:hypothetical protein